MVLPAYIAHGSRDQWPAEEGLIERQQSQRTTVRKAVHNLIGTDVHLVDDGEVEILLDDRWRIMRGQTGIALDLRNGGGP